ncbi:MAG: RAMP superfamily CRISPR-associated protein, partial [Chitinophagales bacterium]
MNNYKYTIKTLTPIHIGSGKTIQRNHEYVYLPQEKAFAFLEDAKVLEVIGEENIDKWMTIIERKEDLLPYLQQRSNEVVHSSVIARHVVPLQGKGESDVGQIATQLRNGQGRPYVPGSSLKG